MLANDGLQFMGVLVIGGFLAGVYKMFETKSDRGFGLIVFCLMLGYVFLFGRFTSGTVISVDARTVVIGGPDEHRIGVDGGKFSARLQKGDEVKIQKKDGKWVVVEMAGR